MVRSASESAHLRTKSSELEKRLQDKDIMITMLVDQLQHYQSFVMSLTTPSAYEQKLQQEARRQQGMKKVLVTMESGETFWVDESIVAQAGKCECVFFVEIKTLVIFSQL